MRILIVEDEKQLRIGLRELLQSRGYEIEMAEDVQQAQVKIKEAQKKQKPFHLYLLDVMLQKDSGFELCQNIRKSKDATPVIFLTAMDDEDSIVQGLEIGGDDYVTKPFRSRELLSRLEANLRRYQTGLPQDSFEVTPGKEVVLEGDFRTAAGKKCFQSGNLIFVSEEERVFKKGEELKLRRAELELLKYFMQNHGILLRREQILEKLWDSVEDYVEDNTLSVQISRLRQQIGKYETSDYIETVRGMGYRWCQPVTEIRASEQ